MLRKILAAAAIGATLIGCTPTTSTSSSTSTPSVTSVEQGAASVVSAVEGICTANQPLVAAVPAALSGASATTQATANSLLTYYNSVCASDTAVNAAVSADPAGGTSAWLEGIVAGLVTALPTVGALIH